MSFIDPTQKQIMEEQKAFLEGKSFKYKLEYFVTYYLKTVLIIAGAIALVISIIVSIATRKESAGHIIMINSFGQFDTEAFADYVGIDKNKSEITVETECYINPSGSDRESYDNLQRIVAIISAKDAEVIVGDLSTVYSYATSDFFADLNDYFSKEELEALGDKVICYEPLDENDQPTGESIPVFIDITDAPKIVSGGYYYYHSLLDEPERIVFAIVCNTQLPETAMKFYEYINE